MTYGWRAAAVVATLLNFTSAAPRAGASAEGGSFVDTFARIDSTRWLVSNGWSNGDFQDCTFQQANVAELPGGGVALVLQDATGLERPSSCAELQSHATFGYGTYEVRVRAARAHGVVTAFFTYTGPGQKPPQPHDEIDFEFLGKAPQTVQANYFANGVGEHGRDLPLEFDAAARMNDYAFEWTPDALRWFVDGRLMHEVVRKSGEPYPTTPGKICLSIWNGRGPSMAGWLGAFDGRGRRIEAHYQRVAFTRWGDPCQFPESLVCRRPPAR
ncbi:MAG: family 16 glycosylhydrolase [Hyphomicrobium sp.]